jgi:hypothetical protein
MIGISGGCDIAGDNITAMATPEDCAIIAEALELLCEPLYQCADRAQERADDHFIQHGMYDEENIGGRAHLARYHLRHLLRSADLGGWCLNYARPNGEVTLCRSTMQLRMLRPGPRQLEDLAPPPPGLNRARISYYSNPTLNLFGAAGSNLIGVWAPDNETREVQIRIVRPLGAWRVGQYRNTDIEFVLPRLGEDLLTMEFIPSDEGFEFPIEFPEEGEEDADSTDG